MKRLLSCFTLLGLLTTVGCVDRVDNEAGSTTATASITEPDAVCCEAPSPEPPEDCCAEPPRDEPEPPEPEITATEDPGLLAEGPTDTTELDTAAE